MGRHQSRSRAEEAWHEPNCCMPIHPFRESHPPFTPQQSYSHPDGGLQGVTTRFTLPVRALAFSPSGLMLAAGGDDEGIKLVDVTTKSVFRQLTSQVGCCCCPQAILSYSAQLCCRSA